VLNYNWGDEAVIEVSLRDMEGERESRRLVLNVSSEWDFDNEIRASEDVSIHSEKYGKEKVIY